MFTSRLYVRSGHHIADGCSMGTGGTVFVVYAPTISTVGQCIQSKATTTATSTAAPMAMLGLQNSRIT